MIFVSLGTNDKSFIRLLDKIDSLIENGIIKDKVVCQTGYTKYVSDNMEIVDLMDMKEFSKCINSCDLLITHGGVGTILDGLKHNKKIIAFPRLSKYQEHVNDHQIEIINEFSMNGYILTGEIDSLEDLLDYVKKFNPKQYKSNNYKFNKLISNYIGSI